MCLASLSSYPSDIILGGGYWIPMKREFKRDFRSMAKSTLQDNKHLLLPSNSLNKLCIGSFYFIGQTMRETLWRTDRDSNLFKVNLVTRVQSVGNPGNLNWFFFFFATEKDPIIGFLKCQWLSDVPVKSLGKWGYLVVKGEKSFP